MPRITTISLVEDTPHIRDVLRSRINNTAYLACISVHGSAEEAIERIPQAKPDVVIMDIGLPGMNGIDCMKTIKAKCPNIAFLMFTVFDNDANVFNALRAGASGYIMKDEKPGGVIAAIETYLQGGGPMSAAIAKKVMISFHKDRQERKIIEDLTEHQVFILEQISKGLLNKEIADKLGITEGSVKVQICRIYKKLQVNNRVEAINKYRGHQL